LHQGIIRYGAFFVSHNYEIGKIRKRAVRQMQYRVQTMPKDVLHPVSPAIAEYRFHGSEEVIGCPAYVLPFRPL
jgi:hypothetical protein